MYAFGWDKVANTIMDDFLRAHPTNKGELGVLLLRIAAYRLHKYPKISSFLKQASYGAQLSDYLDKVVRYLFYLFAVANDPRVEIEWFVSPKCAFVQLATAIERLNHTLH